MSSSPPGDDLGALIGDVRLEAARRRSDPAYPLGEEQAIDEEMRQWSPQAPGSPLERLAARAEAAAGSGSPQGDRRRSDPPAAPSPDLAAVVAEALRTLSFRLADLEHRLGRVERGLAGGVGGPTVLPFPAPRVPGTAAPGSPAPGTPLLPAAMLPAGPGRVLCFAHDPAPIVGELRGRGVDAYGLTPTGDEFADRPDVRTGQLLDHLASVGDSALRAVLAVGPAAGVAGPGPAEMAAEMGRAAPLAVVVSESPWSWRAREGTAAELASRRPVSPEMWVEAFHSIGMAVEAGYEDGGRAYRVVARR